MNPLYELGRMQLIQKRDGRSAATAFAIQTHKAYMATIKKGRGKYGKHFPNRAVLIESCYSFRHILRNC